MSFELEDESECRNATSRVRVLFRECGRRGNGFSDSRGRFYCFISYLVCVFCTYMVCSWYEEKNSELSSRIVAKVLVLLELVEIVLELDGTGFWASLIDRMKFLWYFMLTFFFSGGGRQRKVTQQLLKILQKWWIANNNNNNENVNL